jgi:regulator of protease activity HflC (stomatin/prohibitin superfamily)
MFLVFLTILFLVGIYILPKYFMQNIPEHKDSWGHTVSAKDLAIWRWVARVGCGGLAAFFFLLTSFVSIDADKTGHLKRIYLGKKMPTGRIIADSNEMGPQAKILGPGFQIIPLIRVLYDVEELDVVQVQQGTYAFLVAKDGLPMPEGQFIAPAFKDASNMIDGEKFMGYRECDDTKGVKGPQLTVLPPGTYRLNRYLFDVYEGKSTAVPTGFVAVIKSNVGGDYGGVPILPTGIEATDLSVPIVPKGYRGVWNEVYTPGEYYINEKAYNVTLVDTRVQTWKYLGGYTRHWIDLSINDDGKIVQTPDKEDIKVPEDAADAATVLRVQGWDVFQDSRVQVQVTPENAPFVVASVGGLQEVENKIITPNYRSILRNVVSQEVPVPILNKDGTPSLDKHGNPKLTHRPREVLDLLYQREELEKAVAEKLIPAGAQAGLTVQWVRFGDPAVPPSLLIPGKRTQLADSLKATYKQEKLAQTERVESEKERARADEQANLMKSQIKIQVADNEAEARKKQGFGERSYMESIAKGQLAQANVLGKEKAFELAYIKEVLAAASENPDMIKFPTTFVMGTDGGGLSGAAAILGASNLSMGLKQETSSK